MSCWLAGWVAVESGNKGNSTQVQLGLPWGHPCNKFDGWLKYRFRRPNIKHQVNYELLLITGSIQDWIKLRGTASPSNAVIPKRKDKQMRINNHDM